MSAFVEMISKMIEVRYIMCGDCMLKYMLEYMLEYIMLMQAKSLSDGFHSYSVGISS